VIERMKDGMICRLQLSHRMALGESVIPAVNRLHYQHLQLRKIIVEKLDALSLLITASD